EFQGAGGQPDDRLIAQYSARQSRVEVILPDVHAVDVVLRHQGSGDVHAVVDEDHRVRIRVGHGRCDLDGELRELTDGDRLAADLDHPSATGRCASSDAGDLRAFLFPVEVRDAAGDEVAGQRPGIQWPGAGRPTLRAPVGILATV